MTNKFKFKLKITGFELEVEGSKEDVATITANVSSQLKGMVQPQGLVIGQQTPTEDVDATVVPSIGLPKKRSSKKTRNTGKTTKTDTVPISLKVDAHKYGAPTMQWSTLNKGLWIMYVVKQEALAEELTIAQISEAFNNHYKQAGAIRSSNISRDLGKCKVASSKHPKPLVGETVNISPTTWYLTDAGNSYIQSIITQQRNGASGKETID